MSILAGLMGHAAEADPLAVQDEMSQIMTAQERIEKAYKLIRDALLFTNKRLILVVKQGIMGSRVEYKSIPYRSISCFSVEAAGPFDFDSMLKIWLKGDVNPIELPLNKKINVYEVQEALADYVMHEAERIG